MNKKVRKASYTILLFFMLAMSLPVVSMAQEYEYNGCPTKFFPLTSRQIDYFEEDRFYVHFDHIVLTQWHNFVFNTLQHTDPIKKIDLTLYGERMIYDEPTLVDYAKATVNYNGDAYNLSQSVKFDGHYRKKGEFRVWQNVGFSGKFFNTIEAEGLIIGAKGRSEKTIRCDKDYYVGSACIRVVYDRDDKDRVIKATVRNKKCETCTPEVVEKIITYSYLPNTNNITEIKIYNKDGKLMAEVHYNYLTTANKPLLSKATYEKYDYSPSGKDRFIDERYVYSLYYDSNNVQQVEMVHVEGRGEYAKSERKRVLVNIVRDNNNYIKECTCIDNNLTYTWNFTYDAKGNWNSVTRERKQSGNRELEKLVRSISSESQPIIHIPQPTRQNTTSEKSAGVSSNASEVEEVFSIVEEMPFFPGGYRELEDYLSQNLQYPPAARNNGVQGRVLVGFIVEIDGSLSNISVAQGIGSGCDEEAERVVKNMPKWKPGMRRGKPVRVRYTLPVDFK